MMQTERQELVESNMLDDFRALATEFEQHAAMRLGTAGIGHDLHEIIDRIMSEGYGMEFAYCGREHTVL